MLKFTSKRVRLSLPVQHRHWAVQYSTASPVPKANVNYLTPTHLDDSPSAAVVARLARYNAVTLSTYARPPFILTKGKRYSV